MQVARRPVEPQFPFMSLVGPCIPLGSTVAVALDLFRREDASPYSAVKIPEFSDPGYIFFKSLLCDHLK